MIKVGIILYVNALQRMGGIETFIKNFVDTFYKTYDIAVVIHESADAERIEELERLVPVYFDRDDEFECSILISNNLWPIKIPESIKYKKKLQMLHCTKLVKTWRIPEGYDTLISVSQHAANSFGVGDAKVMHNLLSPSKPKKVLRLISMTRLTHEKGGQRMLEIAKLLNRKQIPFLWIIFTSENSFNTELLDAMRTIPGMVIMPPAKNARDYILGNDYLVQLSDDEAYCYSIVEALEQGIPVLTTPVEPLKEIGFVDGVHGYIVPFEITEDITEKIMNIPKFEYETNNQSIISEWKKMLGKKTAKASHKLVAVECLLRYFDVRKNRIMNTGEIVMMMPNRAAELSKLGYVRRLKHEE